MKNTSFVRTWTPCNERQKPTHTLWIYDAGDTQGFLVEDSQGRKEFTLYKHQSREYNQDGCIQETGMIEYCIPKDFFSIESYPCSITPAALWLPQWKIQTSLQASDSSVQMSPSAPQQPSQRHNSQQHQQPSPLRQPKYPSPASPVPAKSHSSKREPSQRNERNMRNTLPRPTFSPSSNPISPAQQQAPNPKKPVLHHQRPSSKKQTVPPKPSSSHQLSPQKPPSSQLPQEHA